MVVSLVKFLVEIGQIPEQEITVLCMYAKQVELIQGQIGYPNLHVSSVDSYQENANQKMLLFLSTKVMIQRNLVSNFLIPLSLSA